MCSLFELNELLKPLNELKHSEENSHQRYAKKRIGKLRHKLDALNYHSTIFKNEEKIKVNRIRESCIGTLYTFAIDEPVLIYTTESFLFQSKSCLDVLAQLIGYFFKLTGVRTYKRYGDDLIDKIVKNPLKDNSVQCDRLKNLLVNNRSWVKYLVEMRDEVTHYSDLEGLACFLQKKVEGRDDKHVTIYYPSLTDGTRVSTYMDEVLKL